MRKITLICLILSFFLQNSFGQLYQGREAAGKLPGSKTLRFKEGRALPDYIQLGKKAYIPLENLKEWMSRNLSLSQDMDFALIREQNDQRMGMKHYRYEQKYKGLSVWDAQFIAHTRNQKVESLNGVLYKDLQLLNREVLSKDQARDKALEYVNAEVYKWQVPGAEALLKKEKNDPDASYYPQGELILFPNTLVGNPDGHRFTYKFDVYAQKPLKRAEIFIDAETGQMLFENNRIRHADTSGTAVTRFSGTQPIVTDYFEEMFRLRESSRGNGIETYNLNQGTDYAAATDFLDNDNYWDNVNPNQDEVATDAHWGAEMTYDYFYIKHNRNSIDDLGFKLKSYVHFDVGYDNAFWDGERMTYGDGTVYLPFTALDVCGHEVTHGLTEFSANLVYAYEPGAMNEAFSDIFGTAIEFYGKPDSANWLMGEDIGAAFRNVSNPNQFNDPDTYLGDFWFTGSNDNGGVHTNSGVLNYWFYLTAMGGTGTNDLGNPYSITGIGLSKAADVAYRTLTVYLTQNSQYADARFWAIQSSADLYGACSPEMEAVTNAMYAIGVGPAYVTGVTCDFLASNTSFCNVPAPVSFTNNSVNAFDFLWDFGDGTTDTLVSPNHTYYQEGNYTVKLIADGEACGIDSLIMSNLIVIDLPDAPMVISDTSCTGPASLTLYAIAPDSVRWFASASIDTFFYTGTSYTTPVLSQPAHYYVENQIAYPKVNGGKPDNSGNGNNYTSNTVHYLIFNALVPIRIISVKVYAGSAGNRAIELRDNNGNTLITKNIVIPQGESRITLNFDVPAGSGFQLVGPPNPGLYRNTGSITYPYLISNIAEITQSSAAPLLRYYFFYDWEVMQQACVSERKMVSAMVFNGSPDASFAYSFMPAPDLTVQFQNSSSNGYEYLWDFGDGTTSLEENPLHTYLLQGQYTVNLTVTNSCGTDFISQSINVVTGIGEQESVNAIDIVPNPNAGNFRLTYVSGLRQDIQVKIQDLPGRELWSETYPAFLGVLEKEFTMNDLPAGVYSISVLSTKGKLTKKLIIR